MEHLLGTANRGSVSTTYSVDNSIFLDATDPEEMHYTTGSSSSDSQKGTFSFWMKRGRISYGNFSPMQINDYGAPYHAGAYWTNDQLYWNHKDNSSQWTKWERLFRDPSAWYHVVVRIDTTQADGDDRHRMYINGGSAEPITTTHNAPVSQNDAYYWFANGRKMTIGGLSSGDAYIADYHYVDGQSLAPTEFGETDEDSGIWKPKKYGGTYGNNGFKLEFKETGTSANSSGIGADTSGNGHHFTLIGIAATNQATDTPSNNFCTLNPLLRDSRGTGVDAWDITDGNLVLSRTASGWNHFFATIPVTNGKWYWEAKYQNMGYSVMGWHDVDAIIVGEPTTGVGGFVNYNGGEMRVDNAETSANYGTVVNDSNIGVALNMDDNQVTIYIDNSAAVSNYSIGNSANKYVVPFMSCSAASTATCYFNFGGYTAATISSAASDGNGYGTFEYAPPSGYYALCTKNLAEFG